MAALDDCPLFTAMRGLVKLSLFCVMALIFILNSPTIRLNGNTSLNCPTLNCLLKYLSYQTVSRFMAGSPAEPIDDCLEAASVYILDCEKWLFFMEFRVISVAAGVYPTISGSST